MLKESKNEVYVEGLLAEKNVRELDNGAVAGNFVFQVDFEPEAGVKLTSTIPVDFYAAPKTKAGRDNPVYKSVNEVIATGKALADGFSEDEATRIRCRQASLRENSFVGRNGELVTYVRLQGAFFDKVKPTDFNPQANFKVRMVVSKIAEEMRRIEGEMQETGAIQVTGLVVQWNSNVDEIKFLVKNKRYIDAVEKYWTPGDTVNATGYLSYTTEAAEYEDEPDGFGVPQVQIRTRQMHDLVINNGSPGPIEDGYDKAEVKEAMRDRDARMKALLEKESKPKSKPADDDMGF